MADHNTEPFTATEDGLLRSYYAELGPTKVLHMLDRRTRRQVRHRVTVLGLTHESNYSPRKSKEAAYPLPGMDDAERADCRRLVAWRGPVQAGQLSARL